MSSLWLAKWPNGEVVLARADDEEEVLEILDEQADPGSAQIEEYDGPLVLEFRAELPGHQTFKVAYCRPRGEPPAADATRQRLWEQAQQGRYCDAALAAADGAQRRAHRAVLCAACPALEPLLERAAAGQPVAVEAAPTAAIMDCLLHWLYLGRVDFAATGPEEVLPAALALELPHLAEECDHEMAARFGRTQHGPPPAWPETEELEAARQAALVQAALELLAFADRHGRARLAKFAVGQLPGDSWRMLRALPAFEDLPGPLQAAASLAASQRPPMVLRTLPAAWGGQMGVSCYAREYRDAGGRLSEREAEELLAYEQLQEWQAAQAAAGGGPAALRLRQVQGGGQQRRAPAPAAAAAANGDGAAAGLSAAQELALGYEVTPEDIEASGLGEEFPELRWKLTDGFYEGRSEFMGRVAALALPHLAAEMQAQQDEAVQCATEFDEAGRLQRMRAAVLRQQAAMQGGEGGEAWAARYAGLVARAERGDHQAAVMVAMNISRYPGLGGPGA